MKSRLYRSGRYWYAKISLPDGSTKNIALRAETREKAEENLRILLKTQHKGERKRGKTLRDWLYLFKDANTNPYIKERRETGHNIKASTARENETKAKMLLSIVPDEILDKSLNRINAEDCKRIRDIIIHSDRWMQSTKSDTFAYFSRTIRTAQSCDLISSNPCEGLMGIYKTYRNFEIPTKEDIERMAFSEAWASEEKRDIFLIYALTGMRQNEVRGLQRDQISEEMINGRLIRILRIDRQYSDLSSDSLSSPKRDIVRTIPLADKAWQLIDKYAGRNRNSYFILPYGSTFFKFGGRFNSKVNQLIESDNARLRFSTHKLRHFLNSAVIDYDDSLIAAVGEYCGWNHQIQGLDNIAYLGNMQRRYTHRRAEYLLKVADAIDDIFSWLDVENLPEIRPLHQRKALSTHS